MDVNIDNVRRWLARPNEGLDRELKAWIDPSGPAGKFSLVKGLMALRNRDGGMLAIGFDNKTGAPLPPPSTDWKAAYHLDVIQGLVSKHASHPFEVAIKWIEVGECGHPVIVVEGGVRTPVAVKSPIIESGRELLPVGAVYFRTLEANGTPSSAPASYRDWDEIMRLCFDNREADIGRFVRRHLSPMSLPAVFAAFGLPQADNSLRGQALSLLDEGEIRFQEAYAAAGVKSGHEAALTWGYNAVALVVAPSPRDGATPLDHPFLNALYAGAHSTRTAIPPWHDGRNLMSLDTRPYTKAGAYEMLLDVPDSFVGHFEFSRLDPKGRFYCRSALHEETRERRFHPDDTPTLDPAHAVGRVTEAFLTGAAFARAMGADEETSKLGFALRWGGLKGRKLHNWNSRYDYLNRIHKARGDDDSTTFVELPLTTPPSALGQYVTQVVAPLFTTFDWSAPRNFVEHFTKEAVGGE